MKKLNTGTAADLIRLSVLTHISEWLAAENIDDITQVDDEYILRQMAKYDCHSRSDVSLKLEGLKRRLHKVLTNLRGAAT